MKIHVIMHESFESPAAIANWVEKRGFDITYTRLYQGDFLPTDASDFDFLVVMGGPQSPATTKEICPYFDSKAEIALVKKAIEDDKLVFGVCLGAQLIGEALGAKFEHSPNREIGIFDITLTSEAKDDPIFAQFPSMFPVGHWHGDMPGLTKDAVLLAFSEGCPRQVVKYTEKVYGFQCHFEFTRQAIEGMIENCGHELISGASLPYIQNADQLRVYDYKKMNELLFIFLDQLTNQCVLRPKTVL